ncbi:hypothetical protein MKZ38_007767 [Zalerion maritima]|uniref:Uncharacterized protein n=1 Tax=Zalerion maritima TaxID=339359 RepID=A0AAD5WU42_9PEZI|nr:hypothetical protein MKZ38_007767 [Zalerion maritima]
MPASIHPFGYLNGLLRFLAAQKAHTQSCGVIDGSCGRMEAFSCHPCAIVNPAIIVPSPDTQYAAFGGYVKSLADNTQLLVDVVDRAEDVLRTRGAHPADCGMYDLQSLVEILGNLKPLLDDCYSLLKTNERYQRASGVVDNIEWNVMVQPNVDKLVDRIAQHNARIEHFIRPFEIDVMTRMYDHIIRKIDEVQATTTRIHELLLQLIRSQDRNLYDEIRSKETRRIHTIPMPQGVRDALEREFNNHPDKDLGYPSLQAISDSFITQFGKSTKSFRPGLTLMDRTPPMLQYVCLFKCIFLLEKIKAAHDLRTCPANSHWHSYVRQMEDDLSSECRRFQTGEIGMPTSGSVSADMIGLWPDEEPEDIIDFVKPQLLMDKLVECRLVHRALNGSKKLTLLRHTGSHDERFRLILEATQANSGLRAPKNQKKVVDFDIRTSHLKPLYALPNGDSGPIEMILRANSEIFNLVFETLNDALRFQQALTCFRPWGVYCGYIEKVAFFTNGNTTGLPASLQLWVPDRIVGDPVTSTGTQESEAPNGVRSMSMASTSGYTSSRRATRVSVPTNTARTTRPGSVDYLGIDLERRLQDLHWDRASLSNPSSPNQATRPPLPIVECESPSPTTSVPVTSQRPSVAMPAPSHQESVGGPPISNGISMSPLSISPDLNQLGAFPPSHPSRRMSGVSVVSGQTSSSYPSDETTSPSEQTVSILTSRGTRSGVLHVEPVKPMLVMFTRNGDNGGLSIICMSIDNLTKPNHERCNCQQTNQAGRDCPITVIERSKGDAPIEAKILGPYMSDADTEWDVLKLAASRRGDSKGFGGCDWYGLQRVSIRFRSADDRFKLVGRLCFCANARRVFTVGDETACMRVGHVGLFGEVRIRYRRELQRYYVRMNQPRERDVINPTRDKMDAYLFGTV